MHNFIPEYAAFLGYASPKGHALIDRRLYLPKDWIEDAERRKAANIPADLTFASKPKIGIAIVAAALDAGVPCAWVLGDSVYGSDKSCASCWSAVTSRMFSPFAAMRD